LEHTVQDWLNHLAHLLGVKHGLIEPVSSEEPSSEELSSAPQELSSIPEELLPVSSEELSPLLTMGCPTSSRIPGFSLTMDFAKLTFSQK
jgi:hypothetical protein